MTLQDLIAAGFEAITAADAQVEITGAYTSDLLSDVMAHCPDGAVLISVQNHKNTVAVATLVGAAAVLITHEREMPEDMIEAANKEGIALLRTTLDQFNASVKIASLLGAG